jgi:hypothetical protein
MMEAHRRNGKLARERICLDEEARGALRSRERDPRAGGDHWQAQRLGPTNQARQLNERPRAMHLMRSVYDPSEALIVNGRHSGLLAAVDVPREVP